MLHPLDGNDVLVLDRRQQPGGAVATACLAEVRVPGLMTSPAWAMVANRCRDNISCSRLCGGVVEARLDTSHRLAVPGLATQFREVACGGG